MDIRSIPIPPMLARRPKDVRGLPIPFIQAIPSTFAIDRKVDFRVTDLDKRLQCIYHNLCSLCGTRLFGKTVYFIGGPLSFETKAYSDPAMHLGCANFAIAACPFLNNPNYRAGEVKRSDVVQDALMMQGRPEKMYLVKAKGYEPVQVRDGNTGKIHPMIYSLAIDPEIVREF